MSTQADEPDWQAIVADLSEGVILLAPDGRITFANAAALAMHGVERLDDLGGSVAGFRARYAVHDRRHHPLGPDEDPMGRAARGESFANVVVRVARTGRRHPDWVFRVRSLARPAAASRPASFGLLITDDTDLFESEQRFERTFRANPAPAVICRLSDLRFCRANQGFLDLTGLTDKQVVGRSVYEVDVLKGAAGRAAAIENLHAGRTIPQVEACLDVPADREKWVIVAGHPIEMPGGAACMLFTFADLEDRRKAEAALRQSEDRFAKAFQLTPVPTLIGRLDGFALSGFNDAFARVFGHPLDECVGRSPADLGLWVDAKAERRFARELKRAGSLRNVEACLRTKDGSELDCLVSAEIVTIDAQPSVICAMQDITERRRSERELIGAIEAAMSDTTWFTRGVLDKLAALRTPQPPEEPGEHGSTLTRREREVLKRVGHGATDKEIAAELALSQNTVRNHVTALHRKLGLKRRSAVVAWAHKNGVVDAPEARRSIRAVKNSEGSSSKLGQKPQ